MAPGLEALDDGLDRLDFFDRHRRSGRLELHEPAQRGPPLLLVVDERAVFAEQLEVVRAAGVLQLVDRLGVEEVVLAVVAPLVLAPGIEVAHADPGGSEGATSAAPSPRAR